MTGNVSRHAYDEVAAKPVRDTVHLASQPPRHVAAREFAARGLLGLFCPELAATRRAYAEAFLAAQRFFIARLSFFRPSGVSPPFLFAAFAAALAGEMDSPLIFAHLAR